MLVSHDGETGDLAYFAALYNRAESVREKIQILADCIDRRDRFGDLSPEDSAEKWRKEMQELERAYWFEGDPEIQATPKGGDPEGLAEAAHCASVLVVGPKSEDDQQFSPPPA